MAEHRVLPWPSNVKIPRWARDRRGQRLAPDSQITLQLDRLDRYHIALYRFRGLVPHLVEIVEPDPADRTRQPTVKVTRILWPRDPVAAFERAVANYRNLAMFLGDHRN